MGSAVVFVAPNESTGPKWCRAFSAANGWPITISTMRATGPIAMFGSPSLWPALTRARAEGRTWYYGDHAYFGRNQFYRCTKNALQHTGLTGDADPKRFKSFGIPVKEWRKPGDGPILLCPNSETFLGLHGHVAAEWIDNVTAELRKHTDREIVLRWKKDAKGAPLSEALKTAHAVVTFTSNSAVEAILAGVPAICTEPCAGLSMSTNDLSKIESLPQPEGREDWAARLANNQWTLEEMARGDLWRAIGDA